ncbi:MAG: hypothetical protein WCP10_12410 [Desulfuromonadales bacterium]
MDAGGARELPPLRDELRLHDAGQDWDGSPCWLIHDATANRFHRLGWLEFELLSRWDAGNVQELLQRVSTETTLRPTEEDLAHVIFFLEQNNLTRVSGAAGVARLSTRATSGKLSPEQWLLHNYLFFRIPLLKPDSLLSRIMPLAAPLLTPHALIVFILLAISGMYLVMRQWDVFAASFVNTLTPTGFLGYVMAMAIAKCVHELGHALLAKKAGLRVPRIGIAFLVMFPVLYTDLGEGWLLNDHRRRLISAGGMLAEGYLAAVSLCAWGVLAAGALRDAFYVLAVVSLVRSILINISPFMRFDGYYLLSDQLNLPNLQQRAFAYSRYQIRRLLLGSGETPPEHLPRHMSSFFVIYSLCTWLYRLVVFVGIAIAVYHYFFKSLGIILMLVELFYFIAFPIARELLSWRPFMSLMTPVRSAVLGGTVLLLLLMFFVPWRARVTLPALMTARHIQAIYSPFAARVVYAAPAGKAVKTGERLFLLDAEEVRFQSQQAQQQAAELRDRLRRLPHAAKGRELAGIWSEELLERDQTAKAQVAELKRLVLVAEADGLLMDSDEGVHPGDHVTARSLLGLVVNPASTEIEAFADETVAGKISPGAEIRYYSASHAFKPLSGTVTSIDTHRLSSLPSPALADRHGGTIATVSSAGDRLLPRDSLYRVRIRCAVPFNYSHLDSGSVSVEVRPESVAGRLIRQVVSVLVRESGF